MDEAKDRNSHQVTGAETEPSYDQKFKDIKYKADIIMVCQQDAY
jgi:hypothetical protein